jgi:nucleotide-binding universal stress UspA family protein
VTHRDVLILGFALLSAGLALLLWREVRRRAPTPPARRILFPFDESTFSETALAATLRIARAENATLVPDYLAIVPLRMSLDAALPRRAERAVPILDRIEEAAIRAGVTVDSRIEPGRSYRHALRRALDRERVDRVVIAAESCGRNGFGSDDIAWMLDNAGTELLVLKTAPGKDVLAAAA